MNRLHVSSALLVALSTTVAHAQENVLRHPDGTNHFYRAVSVPAGITWHEANAAAARAGGYLATITSPDENAVVAGLVGASGYWKLDASGKSYSGPWLGGIQWSGSKEPDVGWAWAETDAFSFSNWTAGQPDDSDGGAPKNADRIHFGGAAIASVDSWGDAPADSKLLGYVIEFSGATVLRTAGVLLHERGASDGYTLIAPMNSKTTWLVDPRGRSVRSWSSAYVPGQSCYFLPNGNLLRCGKVNYQNAPGGGHGGIVEEFDWDGNLVWSYSLASSTEILHHDISRMPNGNTLMIVWDYRTSKESIDAGRDPAKLKDGHLWPDTIIEVKPTGKTTGTVVWKWDPFDHLIQDFDSKKANFGDPAKHPELVDINYAPDTIGDWMHTNAIDYNAKLDQVIISVRSFDEFWVIDHSTTTAEAASHAGGRSGKGGDLLLRWGNPLAYRAGTATDQALFKQHDAHWIPEGVPGAGNILVFNNGVGRPGGNHSSVDEIVLPKPDVNGNYAMTGSVWGPTKAVWSYTDPTPARFFSPFVAGAQRLANGHTKTCPGWFGGIRELDTRGAVVWEYLNPIDPGGPVRQGHIQLAAPFQGLFRAPHYAADFAGLKGRTLVPGAPLERHATVLLIAGSTVRHFAKTGTNVELDLRAAAFPGSVYALASSVTSGLIPLDHRFVRMAWDPIVEMSLFGYASSTFQDYSGTLDSNGRAKARIAVPDIPALRGLKVKTTMLVASATAPSGVGLISNTVDLEID